MFPDCIPLLHGLMRIFCVYYPGLFGIMWYILWLFVVHVSPNTHPTISKRERNYINRNIITRKVFHLIIKTI